MGWWPRGLRLASAVEPLAPNRGGQSLSPFERASVASPWGEKGTLTRTMVADIFGPEAAPLTRQEAMRVPALAKGRALICGTLSRQPLALFDGETKLDPAEWMYRTGSLVAPQTRMLWTLDDLIFEGRSLWAVDRDATGQIVDAARVPTDWWQITDDLRVLVNDKEVKADEVIVFEGPQDGLLTIARDDIQAARDMTRAWANRVASPVPLVELHQLDDRDISDDEADELLGTWEKSRKRGGTALTPKHLEVKTHGETVADLFIAGRNAARLDFANFLNLPGSQLDGSTATASLTYVNKGSDRSELVDISLQYWAGPIAARLSQDDVVPPGQRVDFDLTWLAAPSTPTSGPAAED